MAKREDYINKNTLSTADEVDRFLAGRSPTQSFQEPIPSIDINEVYDDPLPPPEFIDLFQVMADASDPSTLPPVLIDTILHKGCKMILSGSSKAGKTLALMHLGLAAANGLSWMGHKINQECKVVYLDFELVPRLAKERIKEVIQHPDNNYTPTKNYLYCGLRGQNRSLDELALHIQNLKDFNPDLVIVDPFYKLGGEYDENDAGSVSAVLNKMERFSEKLGCAFVYAHHFSKGNKSETDHIDRASGSGVFARDPDAILTLTPHEEEYHLVLEGTLRNFPTPDKQVVEFSWPNFIHKPDLEADLRKPGQAAESKKLNESLADKLLGLLEKGQIIGLNVMRLKLQDLTNNEITPRRLKNILRLLKGKIDVQEQSRGLETIYSAKLKLQ
tara:strand:- start:406 stop:1566 length:1161 start_codon:yes stop_codon:yes gene_type:complete